MNLFGAMDTSGSAMQAERMRAEVVAANMANAETTETAEGGPYRRHHVVFAANRPENQFLSSMTRLSPGRGAARLLRAPFVGSPRRNRRRPRGTHRAGGGRPFAAA